LERLQVHKERLQHLQLEQAAAVERLGGAVHAVKGDVLAELARERQQLAQVSRQPHAGLILSVTAGLAGHHQPCSTAVHCSEKCSILVNVSTALMPLLLIVQAVEELQTVVSEQCIKTDQLGTIFAARDNMYGAWLKMQAVFDANKSPRKNTTAAGARASMQADHSLRSTIFRPRHSFFPKVSPSNSGAGSANGAIASAFGALDPFSELLNRLGSSPQPHQQSAAVAASQDGFVSAGPLAADAAADNAAPVPAAAAGPGTGSDELCDIAEAHCQLREEVGSLAVQLHAAIADLSEQVAALRQLPAGQQHQPAAAPTAMPAASTSSSSSSSSRTAAAEAPDAAAAPAPASAAQADGSINRTASPGSGVLHAPLSLVLQLQQELSAMKAESISKEQFAAVVRMVKELRSQSCSSEASSPMMRSSSSNTSASRFAAALGAHPNAVTALDTAAGDGAAAASARATSSTDIGSARVLEVLQQHSQQLAAVESSLEALMHKAASAESLAASQQPQVQDLQQQQADLQQQQLELSSALVQQQGELQTHTSQVAAETHELRSSIGKAQADIQQQDAALAQLATVLASVSVTQKEVQDLSSQQGSLQAELSKVFNYVDELASKLHSAANAAALAVARPHAGSTVGEAYVGAGSGGGPSGFSEMVAGLANLKSCLDQQAKAVSDLSSRLEDQEVLLQGLNEGAAAAAAAEGPTSSGSAEGVSAAEGAPRGLVSKAEVQELAAQLAAVQQKLAVLEQQQVTTHNLPVAGPAAPLAHAAPEAGGTQGEPAAASESDAGGHPLGFMHGMLVELKNRIKKLEADSIEAKATAATVAALTAASMLDATSTAQQASGGPPAAAAGPTAASAPSTPSHKAVAARKGAAWAGHGGQNAAASLQELQEWLVYLQADVGRLDATDASLLATLESLRGDIGAAAAAAAAAAIAAKLTAAGSPGTNPAAATATAEAEVSNAEGQQQTAASAAGASQLWAALEELRAQLAELQQAERTAQAAAWATGDASSSKAAARADAEQLKREVFAEANALHHAWVASAGVVQLLELDTVSAETVKAVEALRQRVDELQNSMAQVASQAAATASLAAAASIAGPQAESAGSAISRGLTEDRLFELQAQLDCLQGSLLTMQQQVQQLVASTVASTVSASPAPQPTTVAVTSTPPLTVSAATEGGGMISGKDRFFTPSSEDAAQQQSPSQQKEGSGCVQKCLSFGDLARSSGGGTATAEVLVEVSEAGFVADFSSVVSAVAATCSEQLSVAAVLSARQASEAAGSSSRDLSRSSSTSSGGSSKSGRVSVRRLLDDMSALPGPKQVAIVSKLACLVSSHATRLLATYHEDTELSVQLQTVQQQLSAAVKGAATGSSFSNGFSGSSGGSPARHISRRISTGTAAAPAPASSTTSSSSEALLCILDQVASLRAIGSATHPAIAEKLQKHEAQLAELKEAQQGIFAAISALNGSSDFARIPSMPLVTTAEPAAASDGSPSASPAASEGSSPPAATTAGAECGEVNQQPGPAYEGELAHRLADVEGRLAAGLKVLSAVRSKLSPLQEVADATQSMMRELQVRSLPDGTSIERTCCAGTAVMHTTC
jgi:hypothetical protein